MNSYIISKHNQKRRYSQILRKNNFKPIPKPVKSLGELERMSNDYSPLGVENRLFKEFQAVNNEFPDVEFEWTEETNPNLSNNEKNNSISATSKPPLPYKNKNQLNMTEIPSLNLSLLNRQKLLSSKVQNLEPNNNFVDNILYKTIDYSNNEIQSARVGNMYLPEPQTNEPIKTIKSARKYIPNGRFTPDFFATETVRMLSKDNLEYGPSFTVNQKGKRNVDISARTIIPDRTIANKMRFLENRNEVIRIEKKYEQKLRDSLEYLLENREVIHQFRREALHETLERAYNLQNLKSDKIVVKKDKLIDRPGLQTKDIRKLVEYRTEQRLLRLHLQLLKENDWIGGLDVVIDRCTATTQEHLGKARVLVIDSLLRKKEWTYELLLSFFKEFTQEDVSSRMVRIFIDIIVNQYQIKTGKLVNPNLLIKNLGFDYVQLKNTAVAGKTSSFAGISHAH
eukprot:TRINITY_DN2480_c0_g1_i1.p1 TRINITY_DN2480_c0_g1~~TRINITY_DN2480_c0_g1_i1.p1  ORF type:complete len:453 (+),score=95.49 TRINITY_DN2480_c0_g1_i1:58-1416(+)